MLTTRTDARQQSPRQRRISPGLGGKQMNVQTFRPAPLVFGQLLRLGKPRVVSLIVFTAIIGMFLAAPA